MNDKQLENAINQIRKINLSEAEKLSIKSKILGDIAERYSIQKPVKSPWTVYSFSLFIKNHRIISYAVIVLVVIMASGVGVASASFNALPGDVLYPIKVSVAEPVKVALAVSDVNKAKAQSELATTRMEEAETLAQKGALDKTKSEEIQKLLDQHTSDLNSTLALIDNKDPGDADDISTTFEAGMAAHARLLDTITVQAVSTSSQKADSIVIAQNARSNAEKVSRMNKRISADHDSDNIHAVVAAKSAKQASAVAKNTVSAPTIATMSMSADAVSTSTNIQASSPAGNSEAVHDESFSVKSATNKSNSLNNRNNKASTSKDVVKNRLYKVKKIIQTTSDDLNKVSSSSDPVRKSLVQDTKNTLNKAEQALNEAVDKNDNGDDDGAYKSALNSERSAKEANIFLNAGLKIRK